MRRRDYYWSLFDQAEKNQIDNLRTDQVEAVFAAIPAKRHGEWWIWRDGFESWKPFSDFPLLLVSLRKSDEHISVPAPPEVSVTGTRMNKIKEAKQSELIKLEPVKRELLKADSQTNTNTSKSISIAAPERVFPGVEQQLDRDDDDDSDVGHEAEGERENTISRLPEFGSPRASDPVSELTPEQEVSMALTLERTGRVEDRDNFRFDRQFEVRIIAGDKVYTNTTMNISLKGMQLKNPLPGGLPRYFNIEIKQKGKVIPVVCTEVKNRDGSPSHRVRIEANDYTPGLLAMLLAAG